MWTRPTSKETYAMRTPSGDHAGEVALGIDTPVSRFTEHIISQPQAVFSG